MIIEHNAKKRVGSDKWDLDEKNVKDE